MGCMLASAAGRKCMRFRRSGGPCELCALVRGWKEGNEHQGYGPGAWQQRWADEGKHIYAKPLL